MKMLSFTLGCALVLLAFATLAACGGPGATAGSTPSQEPIPAVTSASPSPSWRQTAAAAPVPVVKPGQKLPPFSELKAIFAYDRSEPLAYKDLGENDWIHINVPGDYAAREITFMSAGREVHGYFVVPKGSGPFPVVLYGIDRPMDYDVMYKQAAEFAGKGYAGLLVDTPAALDLPGYYTWNAKQDIATWVASVTDLRRGLDVLATLPQIDMGRVGFQGSGYGGAMGAILAGLDRRVKAYALAYVGGIVSTLGSWDTRSGGEHFFAAEGEAPPTGATLKRYEAQMSVVDPAHYIGHNAGATFLLMNAPHEWPAVWREELDALVAATPEPKTVVWVNRNEPATGRTLDGPREPQLKAMYRWLEQTL
jgi:dienelactone hydrolase